jgi:hypothetical protein
MEIGVEKKVGNENAGAGYSKLYMVVSSYF